MKKFKLKRGTSNMFYSEKDDREKQLRFSIRKVSFGAASVAVATLYLFMGSGAVSAAEAQAIQSNEEVAADKDSETEKKSEDPQLTYAAPAAQEQGSAINTEARDEGKQESHPETEKEQAASSERRETITKTQSDENSVSGDSSSPKSTEGSEASKSEGEATRTEEASSKPKVRKRRDADSASTATVADADPDANQTYEAPEDGASVDTLADKLKDLPETVENEKKLGKIDQVGNTKTINQGEVKELGEFGGWKAVNGGKFAVAKKTDRGVFPIETVNTVRSSNGDTMHYWTWVKESVFDRSNNYALFLSKVRTQKNQNERTFDGTNYKTDGESNGISKGLEGFNGIEKTFKVYGQQVGSNVTIEFKTGYTGDIDGRKANYKVELKANKDGAEKILYTVTFDPSKNLTNENMTVTKATEDKNKQYFSTLRSHTETSTYNVELEKNVNRPQGIPGKFKSKLINIPQGYTDYTVSISSADNQHLGMGYQVPWQHYALPVTGEGFKVTQDTKEVAKDLSQKVYNKLTQQKEEDTKWSTPETQADYDVRLQKIKEKIDFGASTGDYKTVVRDALEKQRQLNEEQQIKDTAKDAVDAK
ncbi:YSIRK-type signal peptide-containing protein, partial [Streptococcus pseudopneumoniae]|uniref:YSIRK-type signal peptide-containing protein n=1 Tax=Streptococcus pseudopneumoniae TaxID=257758 RepID=UPI0012FBE298